LIASKRKIGLMCMPDFNSGALIPAWGNVRRHPRACAPLGRGCGMVSWISDSSNLGALDQAWAATRIHEGSRPLGAGCGVVAWIRDSSNRGALVPYWGMVAWNHESFFRYLLPF